MLLLLSTNKKLHNNKWNKMTLDYYLRCNMLFRLFRFRMAPHARVNVNDGLIHNEINQMLHHKLATNLDTIDYVSITKWNQFLFPHYPFVSMGEFHAFNEFDQEIPVAFTSIYADIMMIISINKCHCTRFIVYLMSCSI